MRTLRLKIYGCGALAIGLFCFQNCGESSFQAAEGSFNGISSSSISGDDNSASPAEPADPAGGATTSKSDRLVGDCFAERGFDGCVFMKNPVAQANSPEGSPWYSSINSRQRYGVYLRGLNTTGYLENENFKVMGSGGTTTTLARMQKNPTTLWRTSVNEETTNASKGNKATQVSAYYWVNWIVEYLEASPVLQTTHAKDTGLMIYPYATVVDGQAWQNAAFYSGGTRANTIIMGYGLNNTPLSFSGEVVVHEFTHALVYHANTNSNALSTATHKYCLEGVSGITTAQVENSGVCCRAETGCMKAMNEGLADYFASVAFPSNPRVGESLVNNIGGLMTCGVGTPRRDVRENADRTPASVFNLCQGTARVGTANQTVTYSGEGYTMASVYASMLWEIRKSVKSALPQVTVGNQTIDGGEFFDSIVHEHLLTLTGSSTFSGSRMALKSAGSAIVSTFGIQLGAVNLNTLIDAEFSRRGIN